MAGKAKKPKLREAQLKVGKEDTNEVGRESGTFVDKEANPHQVIVHNPVLDTSPESEKDNSGSDDTPNPLVRRETFRHCDCSRSQGRMEDSSLGCENGFSKWKVSNGEFIIIGGLMEMEGEVVRDGTELGQISRNEFKKRMASQFEMSDLGELTYYLGIEVSQGKDCIEIKQERYAMKILKEVGMEDCNATLYLMEKDLKLSKAEDELEVEASQYQKVVGCLRYLLHTRPDLTYSVGVVQLRWIKYNRSKQHEIGRYSDSSHNDDVDEMTKHNGHVFLYLFMAATAAACQAIWLRELLAEVTGLERQKVIVEHVSGENQRADPLTKDLARIKFKEMRSLLGV
ncbi:uncharacterized mitochondrial protein-like protein [Tanacetum coccineum]